MTDDNGTQDSPIQDGSDEAGQDEKLRGLVAQIRHDFHSGVSPDPEEDLRRRLGDSGIELSDDEFATVLADIRAE
ncbi:MULTISPECIES: hypothetical protein [Microbacteriaceae]|uniref:Uncharacterized protein n=1 Tax=Orlajensenia leifsoniae TaxID=2561933 RepID=A0A4Y9R0T9_9MICO|nr:MULTISPECIES: hypothetical protein [Leifsonia]KQQ93255.1 hypothetical protein ASF62_16205 [Leifsonia sp. Leaf325]TFV98341.1 hypothetical protein E4M00_10080 [Leifsonia flava]